MQTLFGADMRTGAEKKAGKRSPVRRLFLRPQNELASFVLNNKTQTHTHIYIYIDVY